MKDFFGKYLDDSNSEIYDYLIEKLPLEEQNKIKSYEKKSRIISLILFFEFIIAVSFVLLFFLFFKSNFIISLIYLALSALFVVIFYFTPKYISKKIEKSYLILC